MRRVVPLAIAPIWVMILMLPACSREADHGPPSVNLGDSMCDECGMIVSDERFATASVIMGDRGRKSLIFDDFNCQFNFERKLPELEVITRWSHDYGSSAWIETAKGWFVTSPEIHTPMASSMVFFQSRSDADQFAESVSGTVVSSESIR